MRKLILWLLVLVAVGASGTLGWFWLQRPALERLPRAAGPADVAARSRLAVGGRHYFRISLAAGNLPATKLAISYPADVQQPRPALVMLGDPAVGRELLTRLPEHGPNVLVALDWPVTTSLAPGLGGWLDAPSLVRNLYAMPGQLAAVVDWLARQDYVRSDQITLVGLGLGSRVVPAARRLARQAGSPAAATALTVAGPSLAEALAGGGLRGDALARVLGPVGPAAHVRAAQGPSLLIAGPGGLAADRAARAFAPTPAPRTVVTAGGADGVARTEALRLTRTWLARRGLLAQRNPVPEVD